jgi:hypothetical protein
MRCRISDQVTNQAEQFAKASLSLATVNDMADGERRNLKLERRRRARKQMAVGHGELPQRERLEGGLSGYQQDDQSDCAEQPGGPGAAANPKECGSKSDQLEAIDGQPRPTSESVTDFNRPTWIVDIDLPWPVNPEGDRTPAPSHAEAQENKTELVSCDCVSRSNSANPGNSRV